MVKYMLAKDDEVITITSDPEEINELIAINPEASIYRLEEMSFDYFETSELKGARAKRHLEKILPEIKEFPCTILIDPNSGNYVVDKGSIETLDHKELLDRFREKSPTGTPYMFMFDEEGKRFYHRA